MKLPWLDILNEATEADCNFLIHSLWVIQDTNSYISPSIWSFLGSDPDLVTMTMTKLITPVGWYLTDQPLPYAIPLQITFAFFLLSHQTLVSDILVSLVKISCGYSLIQMVLLYQLYNSQEWRWRFPPGCSHSLTDFVGFVGVGCLCFYGFDLLFLFSSNWNLSVFYTSLTFIPWCISPSL